MDGGQVSAVRNSSAVTGIRTGSITSEPPKTSYVLMRLELVFGGAQLSRATNFVSFHIALEDLLYDSAADIASD
jgi:hypothetical protein